MTTRKRYAIGVLLVVSLVFVATGWCSGGSR